MGTRIWAAIDDNQGSIRHVAFWLPSDVCPVVALAELKVKLLEKGVNLLYFTQMSDKIKL
jgi:hypothetical protein